MIGLHGSSFGTNPPGLEDQNVAGRINPCANGPKSPGERLRERRTQHKDTVLRWWIPILAATCEAISYGSGPGGLTERIPWPGRRAFASAAPVATNRLGGLSSRGWLRVQFECVETFSVSSVLLRRR